MSNPAFDPNREKNAFMSDKAYGTLLCILSDTLFSIVYVFVQFINKGWFLGGSTFNPTWRGDWILCFKEWIAAAFALPIFLYLWKTGKTSIPGVKVIVGLIIAAFFCEYIGIGHHVLANDLIGMALGLPVIRTITILGCAIFGALLLREKITSLKLGMIFVLIAAVGLFGYSNSLARKAKVSAADVPAVTAQETVIQDAAQETGTPAAETAEIAKIAETAPAAEVPAETAEIAEASPATEVPAETAEIAKIAETAPAAEVPAETVPAETASVPEKACVKYGSFTIPCDPRTFGFLCAFITGMGYAIYTLILRAVMKKPELKEGEEAPKPVSAYFVVSMVFGFGGLFGFIAMLGKLQQEGLGLSALVSQVPAPCWYSILAAGILTFFAFYLKNLSYRYASASKAAAMSVLQVLLNIFAGMLIFSEPTNPIFWAGAVLTVFGIILASRTN